VRLDDYAAYLAIADTASFPTRVGSWMHQVSLEEASYAVERARRLLDAALDVSSR
jgi:hypothetical protein